MASSGKDGVINLTDITSSSPSIVPAISIRTSNDIRALSFHTSSLYISVGTVSGYIYLYDWRNTKKPIVEIPSYNHQPIYGLMFQKQIINNSNTSIVVSSTPAPSTSTVATTATTTTTTNKVNNGNNNNNNLTTQPTSRVISKNLDLSTSTTSINNNNNNNNSNISLSKEFLNESTISHETQSNSSFLSDSQFLQSNHHHHDTSIKQQSYEKQIETKNIKSMNLNNSSISNNNFINTQRQERYGNQDELDNEFERERNDDNDNNNGYQDIDDEIEINVEQGGNNNDKIHTSSVSKLEFTEALQLLKYEIHQDVNSIIREQVRQFAIAKVSNINKINIV